MRRVKGMRDYLPDYQQKLNYVIDVIRAVYESYGYLPMDTPAMEELDVLAKKSGEDIRKQLFVVEGKYGLRFDHTVPLSRVISENQFPRPFKRYVIGKVWRHEEPQKGRYREFYQADIDIVGVRGIEAEAEILACISRCLSFLGVDHTIRVNDRRFVNSLLAEFGFDDTTGAMRLLDKLDKLGPTEVKKLMSEKGDAEGLFNYINQKMSEEQKLDAIASLSPDAHQSLFSLKQLARYYNYSFVIDFSLVRGLDYYTGVVFEVSTEFFDSSVAGGGRYDDLLGLYGKPDYAVGASIGVDRLLGLLEIEQRLTKRRYYLVTDESTYHEGIVLAENLRAKGNIVLLDLMKRSLQRQLEEADKKECDFVFIYGVQERESGSILVKDLKKREQKKINLDQFKKEFKI